MSLLQSATNDQIAVKVAVFGRAGAGKTLTSTLFAVGLSKERHGGAKIAMLDTESGSDFVAHLCQVEGVELLRIKSRSFVDMRDALLEAEQAGCCAYLVDSYSLVWNELNESFRTKMNLVGRPLTFQHREQLEGEWQDWIDKMLASPLHTFLIGRLGHEWEDVETDDGDIEHVRLQTKLRGKPDAGHEPHLLLEMSATQAKPVLVKSWKKAGVSHRLGGMVHACHVLKDRWRALNGVTFEWNDINDYKIGDYKSVYAKMAPHVSRLSSDPVSVSAARSSAILFTPRGESHFAEDERRRTVAIEEIHAAINTLWPGQTTEEKRMRNLIQQALFYTRSASAIAGLAPEVLESAWHVMQFFETAAGDPDQKINIKSEAEVIALIASCKALEQDKAVAF
jgi:hypothetical protein